MATGGEESELLQDPPEKEKASAVKKWRNHKRRRGKNKEIKTVLCQK